VARGILAVVKGVTVTALVALPVVNAVGAGSDVSMAQRYQAPGSPSRAVVRACPPRTAAAVRLVPTPSGALRVAVRHRGRPAADSRRLGTGGASGTVSAAGARCRAALTAR
jgi:hypothetical protein